MYSVVLLMAMSGAPEMPAFCRGCRGCSGCFGCHGCRGCGCWGCHGCYGCGCSCFCSCGGCYGYCGGYGYSYPGCHGCCGGMMVVPHKAVTPPPGGGKEITPPKEVSNQATVRVSLPAEATLTIDGSPTRQTSAERLFVSPALEVGKTYYYTVQAEVQRDGKPVTLSKRVSVQAGQTSYVSFDFQRTEVAAQQ